MRLPRWSGSVAALVAPAAVAGAALPLRPSVPNAAIAATIVGIAALVGAGSPRLPAIVGAVVAAAAYDVLWTRPYGSLQIRDGGDVVTGVVVLLVGVLLAERGRRPVPVPVPRRPRPPVRRRPASPDAVKQLLTIGRVAEDIAEGDDAGLVVLDIARGLVELLGLRDCWLELAPLAPSSRPALVRSGEVELRGVRWSLAMIGASRDGFDIPIVAQGEVVGRFVCLTRRLQKISHERMLVALTLADQAASALLLSHR